MSFQNLFNQTKKKNCRHHKFSIFLCSSYNLSICHEVFQTSCGITRQLEMISPCHPKGNEITVPSHHCIYLVSSLGQCSHGNYAIYMRKSGRLKFPNSNCHFIFRFMKRVILNSIDTSQFTIPQFNLSCCDDHSNCLICSRPILSI